MADEAEERQPRFLGSFDSSDGSIVPEGSKSKAELEAEKPNEEAQPEPGNKPEVVKPEVADTKSAVTEPEYWKKLSGLVGEDFADESQVISRLKSGRELATRVKDLEVKAKNFEGLDPLAVDVDRAAKSGIDVDLFLEARKLDVNALDTKKALQEKFLRENTEYDRPLALKMFELEYKGKYGILTKDMDDMERADKVEELEIAKIRLEAEGIKAKRFLGDWKAKNVTIPDKQVTGPTEEQVRVQAEAYQTKVKEYIGNLGELEIPVGDQVFKFGTDTHLKDISAAVGNPIETLKLMGVDIVKGEIDPEKFGDAITKLLAVDYLGKPLADWALEQSNAAHVKAKLEKPAPNNAPAGGDLPEKSHDERVAAAFEAADKQKRQGIR